MIECTNKNIWYKKKRKKSAKRLFAFLLLLIISLSLMAYYRFLICTQIFKISSDYAYAYSTEAVNEAVLYSLSESVNYNDLMSVVRNNDGDIVLMSANSYKVNYISREITKTTSNILDRKLKGGIPIPLLAFSGIEILSAYGKEVNFKALNVSSVICDFSSEFKAVGINQTLHSIYVNVICDVKIEVPLAPQVKTCETSVLISETVLIGKVPEIYLNGKLFG